MILTLPQLEKVKAIVRRRHAMVILRVFGPDVLTREERAEIEAAGIDFSKVTSEEVLRWASIYGAARAAQQAASPEEPTVEADTWTLEDLRRAAKEGDVPPQTKREQRAVEVAGIQAGQRVRGLGNRVDIETGDLMIEADRELRADTEAGIRDATATAIAERKTAREIKSDLGWKAKDWSRDWDRIAVTELQDAHLKGQAAQLEEEHGNDAWVFKRPRNDACEECKEHYLGADGAPRLFRLSELEGMGTNIGRRRAEWVPTLGPLHAHCRCVLSHMPDGWGFNEDGDMIPGGKLGMRYGGAVAAKAEVEAEPERREAEPERRVALKKSKAGDRIPLAGGVLSFRVENPPGSTRHWHNRATGMKGETKMLHAYGFLERTEGADNEEYDAYLGPEPDPSVVYVVHQLDPRTGEEDEQKAFVGFVSPDAAVDAYLAHRSDGADSFGGLTIVGLDDFAQRVLATDGTNGSITGAPPSGAPLAKAYTGNTHPQTDSVAVVEAARAGGFGNRNTNPYGLAENVIHGAPPKKPRVMITAPVAAYVAKLDRPEARIEPKPRPLKKKIRTQSERLASLHDAAEEARQRAELIVPHQGQLQREAQRRANAWRNRAELEPEQEEPLSEPIDLASPEPDDDEHEPKRAAH